MKKLLLFSLVFLTLKSYSQSTLCITHYCRDSVFLPKNSIPLVSIVTASDPINSRSWVQLSGPSQSVLTLTSNPDSVIASSLITGTYIFQYSVSTTKTSGTGNDTVIVVPPANIPPVAVVPKDTSISLPQNVFILDGSKSFDPDSTIVSYTWSGTGIISQSGPYASVANLTIGTYVYSLTVKDNSGATNSNLFHLTVNPPPPPRKAVKITYDDGSTQTTMP